MSTVPDWIWISFIFATGCCIGSFLNVVIYRLPRGKSIVTPPSACPGCGNLIKFYDNIPLVSWLVLGGRCRKCKTKISVRYFVVELLTGGMFVGLFLLYYHTTVRASMGDFIADKSWFVYALHLILIATFIAASAIDLELWVIPIGLCWFVTAAGLICSAVGGYVMDYHFVSGNFLLPVASAKVAAMSGGAFLGLIISFGLLMTGILKRSYVNPDDNNEADQGVGGDDSDNYNHRLEMLWEILFLLPIIVGCVGSYQLAARNEAVGQWWLNASQVPWVAGFTGSLWGYFVGCAVVWATRIFGTLAFGKEAMGLGDVHLMGAAGAVIGPVMVVVAFFIAPFFGLAWAAFQMFFKKTRQIPYGPFLSMGIFSVMILNDTVFRYLITMFYIGQ
ncbi:MAG: prepilin peptidase [Planctomycetes bacterium]|nr:prepilin peptidase [Planctomycetota bacterium]